MAKKSTFKSNWPKYLLQWGVLALLVFFFSGLASLVFTDMNAPDPKYCPFGGLEALEPIRQRFIALLDDKHADRDGCCPRGGAVFSASCSAAISVPSERWRIF